MKLLTREMLGKTAAKRWKRQYASAEKDLWLRAANRDSGEIYNLLMATTDPDEVDRIIGNDSWTHGLCRECGEYRAPFVTFGEDYDADTVCAGCIASANRMILDEQNGDNHR